MIAAVRLHEVPATIYDGFGVPERWAGVLGGLTIFVPIIVVVALVGGRASKAMYRPGLWTTNRVLGAGVAAALALAAVVVAVLALQASSLPLLPDLVERSPVAAQIVDAASPLVAAADRGLGLGLCDGALEGAEACRDGERNGEDGTGRRSSQAVALGAGTLRLR